MDFKDFCKEYHPEIIEEWERFQNRNNFPAIGAKVKPLYWGFGYNSWLTVEKYVSKGQLDESGSRWGDDYIVLMGQDGKNYLATPEDWWTQIRIK